MREKLIVANWKMNKTPLEAEEFIQHFPKEGKRDKWIEMVVALLHRWYACHSYEDSANAGAQNMHWEGKEPIPGRYHR